MATLLGKLPLLAADYSGALAVFSGMDGYALLCGPEGCLENYSGMEDPEWSLHAESLFTADLRERDIVFGIERSVRKRVRAYVERFAPSFVALVGSPVSAIIGSDLVGLAGELEAELGVPAIAVETTGEKDYTAGIEMAYRALEERFAGEGGTYGSERSGMNVLGYTNPDYCDGADLEALIAFEEDRGQKVCCVVGRCGVEDFAKLGNAAENIVVSSSGLALARSLERRFGTPYTCELPIGGAELSEAAVVRHDGDPERVLIVGDQVISNALRRFIEHQYGASCDVATATVFDGELARPGDVRLKGEADLVLLAAQPYDLVIADPLCRAVVPEDRVFLDLPHLALSSLPFASQHVHLFTSQIADVLDGVLLL